MDRGVHEKGVSYSTSLNNERKKERIVKEADWHEKGE